MADAICVRCGESKRIVGRKLCNACYLWASSHGVLHEYPLGRVAGLGRKCEVPDCHGRVRARDLCGKHAGRMRKHGTLEATRLRLPDGTPTWLRVVLGVDRDPQTGCWNWTRATRNGYGVLRVPSDRIPRWAHRVSYEAFVGPIPDGLHIDHLCENTLCCNPAHLEPVTMQENMRRGREGHDPIGGAA